MVRLLRRVLGWLIVLLGAWSLAVDAGSSHPLLYGCASTGSDTLTRPSRVNGAH